MQLPFDLVDLVFHLLEDALRFGYITLVWVQTQVVLINLVGPTFASISDCVDREIITLLTILGCGVTLLVLRYCVGGFSCSLRPAPSFHHFVSVALRELLVLVLGLVEGCLGRHRLGHSVR